MKHIALTILTIFAIALTACEAVSTGTPTNSASSDGLPIATQLALGTLNLAGTEQEVTAEQAKELVILWKVYEEVSQSDTAAQEEVDALIDQIQATMTTEQMQAITAMNLTQQDVFAAMQSADVTSSTSLSTNTVSMPSGGGDMAGGAPPNGGGTPPDGGGMPADFGGEAPASGTGQSSETVAGSGLGGSADVPSAIVEALIQSLEQKTAA